MAEMTALCRYCGEPIKRTGFEKIPWTHVPRDADDALDGHIAKPA